METIRLSVQEREERGNGPARRLRAQGLVPSVTYGKGKTAVMVDDIIDTAGSLVNGAEALLEKGAKEVYAAATHPVLSGPAYERIAKSQLKEVVVTDTIPLHEGAERGKIVVLSTAGILADTIRNVFTDESVSELFQGENQLF